MRTAKGESASTKALSADAHQDGQDQPAMCLHVETLVRMEESASSTDKASMPATVQSDGTDPPVTVSQDSQERIAKREASRFVAHLPATKERSAQKCSRAGVTGPAAPASMVLVVMAVRETC